MSDDRGESFAAQRALVFSIAYRMLGTVSDAEDVVQETFLRFHEAGRKGTIVESDKAYLAAIATRLSIDYLRSARVRREHYVGAWLPEPVVDDPDGLDRLAVAETVSLAFLVVLEALSPVERAVFLLREVFDYDYADIAAIVEKSEDNCRQILARARAHVKRGRPRFEPSAEKRGALAERFFAACESGDLEALLRLLAADATFQGDGGGKAVAVLQPVIGRDRVARLLQGIFVKGRAMGGRLARAQVNGQPGAITFDATGRVVNVFALDIADDVVRTVRSVINPDKLRHLGPVSDVARLPETPGE